MRRLGAATALACMQAPQTASMPDEGGKSRSGSLEKQRRFLGRDRYMGFHDEPLHGSDSAGRPEQAQRAGSGIPLDVRAKRPSIQVMFCYHAATLPYQALGFFRQDEPPHEASQFRAVGTRC